MADFDFRHGVMIRTCQVVSEMAIELDEPMRYIIHQDQDSNPRLPIDSLLVPKKASEVLIVSFQGALGKGQQPPRFERYSSLRQRCENILFISDTTISPESGILLGWYFGTAADDLQLRLAAFIEHVAMKLGVRRIVLTGSSGGGFAALMIGQKISGSYALAFDPQIRPVLWGVQSFPQRIYGQDVPWRDFEAKFPTRLSVLEDLRSHLTRERFQIIQNLGDTHHVELHLSPLLRFLKIPPRGGSSVDGRSHIHFEHYGDGHVPPPYDLVAHWLDRLVEGRPK